jgi:hypothetical protein
MRPAVAWAGVAALLLAPPFAGPARAAAASAAAAPGTYQAQLCVTLPSQAPSCGAAQAQLLPAGRLRVQVNDIAYRLALPAPRDTRRVAPVVVMHGTMQIDEFSAPFEWQGRRLRFDDADKATRYEVQLGDAISTAPRPPHRSGIPPRAR